jgi:hypothetical protein
MFSQSTGKAGQDGGHLMKIIYIFQSIAPLSLRRQHRRLVVSLLIFSYFLMCSLKAAGHAINEKLLQNLFSVILNVVKDLELVEQTRFFATLRMTNH